MYTYIIRNKQTTETEKTKMTNKEAIERLAIMIKTGASEDTCWNYWIGLDNKRMISDRTYELGTGMLVDAFEV